MIVHQNSDLHSGSRHIFSAHDEVFFELWNTIIL